ncbi:MAG: FAD/NAD(P)-binding protein [Nitrospinaceae bacterium]
MSNLNPKARTAGTVNPMLPRPHRVLRMKRNTRDVFSMDLEPSDGTGPSPFSAGQFNMIYLFGVGEVPISISGDPTGGGSLRHTVRAAGWVTRAMRGLKTGDVVGVRGPFGTPWPVHESEGRDVLLIAGGLGLAPLRPALYHLLARREKYGNIVLLYGARTPDDILFLRELEKWRGRFDLQVYVTVDTARRSWRGNVGVVTRLIPRVSFDPFNTVAMICGPEIMMRFTILELKKYELGPENIFISMERNMKCAVGFCGHCQYGPHFICKDGPVFRYDRLRPFLGKREV